MNAGINAETIVLSLEAAAARCDDLAPMVYARMAAEAPDGMALFRKDARLVQGEMLARVIEALLDFVEGDAWASNFFATEAINHAGYEVPPVMFVRFFGFVADALRDVLGADFTPDMARAWTDLLARLESALTQEAIA